MSDISPKPSRAIRNRRGVALVVICSLMFLILGVVLSMGSIGTQNLHDSALLSYQKQASYVAEAGLHEAIVALDSNPSWSTGFNRQPMPVKSDFHYTVKVTNNYGAAAGVTMTADDGTVVPAGAVYLRSTGVATKGITRTVSAMARQMVFPMFQNAIFAQMQISLGGNTWVDGWDSATGPYTPPTGSQKNAALGTNSTERARGKSGAILLGNNAYVDGNLVVGPTGDPSLAVNGASSATGTLSAMTSPMTLPSVQAPPVTGNPQNLSYNSGAQVTVAPGVYGSLSATGGSVVTLTGGTYYFTGGVNINKASIRITGEEPVVVYFDGVWDTSSSGNIINTSEIPARLRIIGTDMATAVKIAGGTDPYAVVYAPTAAITLSGHNALYGAVVGKTVTMNGGTSMHYDTSLSRLQLDNVQVPWRLTAHHIW